jgi:hypothetical protein
VAAGPARFARPSGGRPCEESAGPAFAEDLEPEAAEVAAGTSVTEQAVGGRELLAMQAARRVTATCLDDEPVPHWLLLRMRRATLRSRQ